MARRRCELRRRQVTEGPLMDFLVRPYVWPSNRYTRMYTLILPASARRPGGGWIHKQLVSRAFNLAPPIRRGRRSPSRLYPVRDLDFLSGKKYRLFFSGVFSRSDVLIRIQGNIVSFSEYPNQRKVIQLRLFIV